MAHEFTPEELAKIKRAEEAYEEEKRRLGFAHLGSLAANQAMPDAGGQQDNQDTVT